MTADTSAVIAAFSSWNEHHKEAVAALADVRSLPAHAMLECYSVLTRFPGGRALSGDAAVHELDLRYPEGVHSLSAADRREVLRDLSSAGVFGGATYDGLVALEARAAGETLLSLDRRAAGTYRRLGVPFELL